MEYSRNMMSLVCFSWLFLCMSSGIFSAQTLAKGTVPASFIFGDSLTDVGNNTLGCIPSQLSKSGQNGGCLRGINTWVSQFNDGAQKLIKELNSKLPAVKITYADTYAMFMELIQNPRAYGFNVSDAPCCNVDTTFGQLCLPNSSLCQQRRDYIFWDAFHPTDAANVVIADMLVADPDVLQYKPPKSLSPSPSPSPVQSPAPARSFRRSPSGAPAPHAKNRPR